MASLRRIVLGSLAVWSMVGVFALSLTAAPPGLAQDGPTPTPPGGRSLAEQVGFADPALSDLEQRGYNTLGESYEFSAHGKAYRLLTVWQMFTGMASPVGGTALLYALEAPPKPIKLVWSFDYARYNGQAPFLYRFQSFGPPDLIVTPGNWSGSDVVYFGLASVHGGTAWSNYIIHIYELRPDDTVISALNGGVIPPGHIVTTIEPIEGSGPVLTVADIRGEMTMNLPNCCGPRHTRFFEWQGGKLTDASAKYFFNYQRDIGYIVYRLTTEQIDDPNEVAARLLELLMIYDSTNQREAGWQFVQGLLAQLKASARVAEGSYIDTVFMPAMRKLHDEGSPFIAPDLIGADPTSFSDWYNEQPRMP